VILTSPPSSTGKPIYFPETDADAMHFLHDDALVMTMHIGCYRMSKILVNGGSSINILYEHVLGRTEDTPELARNRILSQT